MLAEVRSLLDARVAFRDPDIARLVTYEDQRRALQSLGWNHSGVYNRFAQIWTKEKNPVDPDSQLLVITGDPADKAARICELISRIAEIEQIPALRVVMMLLPDLLIS